MKYEECSKPWGMYGLCANLWDDSNAPVVKIIDNNVKIDQEFDGILTKEMIVPKLSYLTRSPESKLYTLVKCDLRDMVININIIND